MKWYEIAFGERYLQLYAHRDRAEAEAALDTLFPESELRGACCLDLACGSGRHLTALRARGALGLGVDLSAALLREAVADHPVVRADMRRIPLVDAAVDITLSMFTSFGYFDTFDEHAELAVEIARVTRRTVVLDLPNPTRLVKTLVPQSQRRVGDWDVDERRWISPDPPRVHKRVEIREGTAVIDEYEERVMLFERAAVEAMFSRADFGLTTSFGDYQGGRYEPSTSSRQLLRFDRRGSR